MQFTQFSTPFARDKNTFNSGNFICLAASIQYIRRVVTMFAKCLLLHLSSARKIEQQF